MANTNRLLKIFLLIAGMAVIVLSSGKILITLLDQRQKAINQKQLF
jgi:hypothetical protein